MRRLKPAVFLDRDGTLIKDVGILNRPEKTAIFGDTFEALRTLQRGFVLFVTTNQPGISRGLLSCDELKAVNENLDRMFAAEGILIKEWYVCPHTRKEGCSCIKPKPEFLLRAAEKYEIDLSASFIIGDHPHDVSTGEEHGVTGLYLLTGHGSKHLDDVPRDKPVFHSIGEAAEWIVSHSKSNSYLEDAVELGASTIKAGGLVAFPTETVYGLGANAFNPNAVARIYEIKKRPLEDPLIVHISDPDWAETLVSARSEKAEKLMKSLWPGPLTIVMPKSNRVPDIVTSGNPTVAIRMPANHWALRLIQKAQTPVAAPSANLFGRTSPTTAAHVIDQLGDTIDVLIDAGACRVGIESTVLSLTDDKPIILRHGGVSQEDIEKLIGPVDSVAVIDHEKYSSPGMMLQHYAPRTPMIVTKDISLYASRSDVGFILFQKKLLNFKGPVQCLSRDGDAKEAATNLYRMMRLMDTMGLKLIVADVAPDIGLGIAINDRLKKATFKTLSGSKEQNHSEKTF